MNKYLILITIIFLLFTKVEAKEYKQFEIPRTEVVPIQDTETGKQYELYIKLPEGYAENKGAKYPVIYFTDAIWHIEILSASTAFILEDVILVGISWQKDIDDALTQKYGIHASRFTDYSFWTTSNPDHPLLKFGQADNHLAFIRNEVFKYVENTYQASSDNRSYFGYSLGGLFGAYSLLTHPDTFKNYILGSPSVQLLAKYNVTSKDNSKKIDANVFISHGDLEEGSAENIETFVTSLKKTGNQNLSITHNVIEGNHSTAFPATGVKSVAWLANLLKGEDSR